MSVKFEFKSEVLTAKLSGDIDHHSAVALREKIDQHLQNIRPCVLKLDFRYVPFMDSSGIGLILGRIKLIKRWGGKIVLSNISEDMAKMAKIAGVFSLVSKDIGGDFE
ncbi:MAG: anti-sigma factor antagonist [Clostridia bacterium]